MTALSILANIGSGFVVILTYGYALVAISGFIRSHDAISVITHNLLIIMPSIMRHIYQLLSLQIWINYRCSIVANLIIVAGTERARVCRTIPLQLSVNLYFSIARLIYITRARLFSHETDNVCIDDT